MTWHVIDAFGSEYDVTDFRYASETLAESLEAFVYVVEHTAFFSR